MEDKTHLLFANWNAAHVRIASKLVPYLCRHRAGLYGVNFPRKGIAKEVRVGWPNPSSKDMHILSIFQPKSDCLLWELRLSPSSKFISTRGPLRRLKMEKGKEDQESQRAKGCIELKCTSLPPGFRQWIEEAFEYTVDLYGID